MDEYTKERVTINNPAEQHMPRLETESGRPLAHVIRYQGDIDEEIANARRLVAVWNFAIGIPTAQLEGRTLAEVLRLLHLKTYPGPYEGRPADVDVDAECRALLAHFRSTDHG